MRLEQKNKTLQEEKKGLEKRLQEIGEEAMRLKLRGEELEQENE